jgi:hypothetical protein
MTAKRYNQSGSSTISLSAFRAVLLMTTAFSAIHLVLQYVNLQLFSEQNIIVFELTNRLDFSDEMSIPTWFAQFLFLVSSVCAFGIALLERSQATFRYWLFLSALLLAGSVNEVASIHESILQIIHLNYFGENPSTYLENAWIVVLPFILIAGLSSLYVVYQTLPFSVVKIVFIAAIVYFTGAVFVDIFDGVITERTFFEQGILAVLEEGLELIGISILLYGLLNYLEQVYGSRINSALTELNSG